MKEVQRVFTVNGKPFYPLGGQADNASGYNNDESETAFKAMQLIDGNTLEIPVYWEILEPEESKFDFSSVDSLIAKGRRYGIKLILLWFGTWFCGTMNFVPKWVKTNPDRFQRIISSTGNDLWQLSPHCQANLDADKRAFTALCKHLKEKDSADQTVIGLQIQNEQGMVGTDRDYSPEAQEDFDSPVPAKLLSSMKAAGKGQVYDAWQEAGGKKSGSWPEIFGWRAAEFISAWGIAKYMDAAAEGGKAVYDIPMFVNVWLNSYPEWCLPGEAYPSGSAQSRTLDIYKWFTPHIDIVAPDIYVTDSSNYRRLCADYSRDDNPLFLPEGVKEVTYGGKSSQICDIFHAIADYNLIGFCFFGVEYLVKPDGSLRPEFQTLAANMKCISSAIPLLLKYQGTGKIHAVAQEEFMEAKGIDFDGFMGIIQFAGAPAPRIYKSWRQPPDETLFKEQPFNPNRGRGLIIQASRNEFYLVGVNYCLRLRQKPPKNQQIAPQFVSDRLSTILTPYISVDEGHFDRNGKYVADRRRNGGQVGFGIWVEPENGVIRVITSD
jgi:hypothetical protein